MKLTNDQAAGLRRLMASPGRLIAVVDTSGEVGSTGVTQNLAAALTQQGRDVLLIDEHNGTQATTGHLEGQLVLIDAVLDDEGALSSLAARADAILVVLQPNKESLTTAFSCIKKLQFKHAIQQIRVLITNVTDTAKAHQILANLDLTGRRYLAVSIESAGEVRADPNIAQAMKLNMTVVDAFQASPAAVDFRHIAAELPRWSVRQIKAPPRDEHESKAPTTNIGFDVAMH